MPWFNITRDSKFRDVTAQLSVPASSGALLVRRHAGKLTIVLDELRIPEPSANVSGGRFAEGFRPRFRVREAWLPGSPYVTATGTFAVTTLGYCNLYGLPADEPISAQVTVDAAGAFPTTFPGDEVPS